ncbi:MAG: YggT family protein [Candidatus Peregrinibacteria bacterium]|nr:YggT family protein [Candidatus Peregrinibacteria bacterium]MDZ4244383.1 YggT family protein [Candidatus Gracilibacteria bacterium]
MNPILTFINVLLKLLSVAIIIRVIFSWIKINKTSPFYLFIRDVTEPIMGFFKKYIPPIGMIDISPIVAIFAIDLLIMIVNSMMY